jgi:SAM-dependent methyltransferase/alpha-beta hydrolase superfamily lysophospholipase
MESKTKAKSDLPDLQSKRTSIPGPDGLNIAAYLDYGSEDAWNGKIVILAPRYGETKKNSLLFAYTLAANGFKVLRFDQTNHIGESDGRMDKFTLSGATNDILAVTDYLSKNFNDSEIILVALSLSCRSGLRACALDQRIRRFVSIVGMVDMNSTLKAIYRRDYFAELSAGAELSLVDILGFQIDGKHFHDDLVSSNMKDLEGSLLDASKVAIPVLHFSAEKDRWVEKAGVAKLLSTCREAKLITLENVGHEINENKTALNIALNTTILFCLDCLDSGDAEFPIVAPPQLELMTQNRLERTQMQKVLRFTETESDFWNDYLGKFGVIEEAHYYVDYFKKVAESLGTLNSGDIILDAGCGNGFYGSSILRQMLMNKEIGADRKYDVCYLGVDLTPDGLNRSYSRHTAELIELHRSKLSENAGISFAYSKLDFDNFNEKATGFPVADNTVSKLCCSLVISYLKDPIVFMKEIHRTLTAGGVAVVSSMKPGCDMTVLYHDYLSVDTTNNDSDKSASELLSAAGRIKVKKDTEVYNFFSRKELELIAFEAGFSKIQCFRSLGDQANVIRIVK